MTFVIPVWVVAGAGGFALGVVFTFWLGLRFNARQAKAAKAAAVNAVTARHGHGTRG